VCVEDPNHLSVKAQEKERPKSLKGRTLSFFEVEWTRSAQGGAYIS
jgi:hypothetical protein